LKQLGLSVVETEKYLLLLKLLVDACNIQSSLMPIYGTITDEEAHRIHAVMLRFPEGNNRSQVLTSELVLVKYHATEGEKQYLEKRSQKAAALKRKHQATQGINPK
jgi:hypothetical protein